jgi:hypothetical protein
MRQLICLFILIQMLPLEAQEATYCVSSLDELATEVKKKSKASLSYPEFGKTGQYLTVKLGVITYYLESKHVDITYDTKRKTLTAECEGTTNCILTGNLTAPNRQSKKEIATLSKASTRELQCYAGYLNQQIRRLKYSRPTANLSFNKKKNSQNKTSQYKTSQYKTLEKKTESPQSSIKEEEKLLTTIEDKVIPKLNHEAMLLEFENKALQASTDCISTLSKIFETYTTKAKAGDKASFRRLYVSLQPLEEQARKYARLAIEHIKNGRDYAKKHKIRENIWDSRYNNAIIYLGSNSEASKPVTQSRIDNMNDTGFSMLLKLKVARLEALAVGAEKVGNSLK